MKLKLLLLIVAGAAGVGASYAVAASTKGPNPPHCRPVHFHGTMASPSTFVITVQKAGPKDVVTTGQVVTLTLGGSGQSVVADAEACATGTGPTATLAGRHVNIHVTPPAPPGKTTPHP